MWLLGAATLFTVVALMVLVVPLAVVPNNGLTVEQRLRAENDLRTTLVQFAGGSILLFGTALTLYINREGQITERFTRAIDQLGQTGEEKLDVRLGGIYALERIARDSKSDRGPIVEVLTAFLREHARWKPDSPDTPSAAPGEESRSANDRPPRLRADFQAAATVLGRNRWSKRHAFDLHRVDLRRVDFAYAHLEDAFLMGAHLERASLVGAQLQDANLYGAHLERAFLIGGAHLDRAILISAHLERAFLEGAHLEGAHLDGAHLDGADLTRAHLEGAYLEGAHLDGADLTGAHLKGVIGLEKAHLDGVIGLDPAFKS